jgi:hypothetical protein
MYWHQASGGIQGRTFVRPFAFLREIWRRKMAQTYSKLRQQAEIAFQQTQVATGPTPNPFPKNDTEADRLRAKTARLRNARVGDAGDPQQDSYTSSSQ